MLLLHINFSFTYYSLYSAYFVTQTDILTEEQVAGNRNI